MVTTIIPLKEFSDIPAFRPCEGGLLRVTIENVNHDFCQHVLDHIYRASRGGCFLYVIAQVVLRICVGCIHRGWFISYCWVGCQRKFHNLFPL